MKNLSIINNEVNKLPTNSIPKGSMELIGTEFIVDNFTSGLGKFPGVNNVTCVYYPITNGIAFYSEVYRTVLSTETKAASLTEVLALGFKDITLVFQDAVLYIDKGGKQRTFADWDEVINSFSIAADGKGVYTTAIDETVIDRVEIGTMTIGKRIDNELDDNKRYTRTLDNWLEEERINIRLLNDLNATIENCMYTYSTSYYENERKRLSDLKNVNPISSARALSMKNKASSLEFDCLTMQTEATNRLNGFPSMANIYQKQQINNVLVHDSVTVDNTHVITMPDLLDKYIMIDISGISILGNDLKLVSFSIPRGIINESYTYNGVTVHIQRINSTSFRLAHLEREPSTKLYAVGFKPYFIEI